MLKAMRVLLCCTGLVLVTSGAAALTATSDKGTAAVTDSEITNAVKKELLADRLVGSLNIDVETTKRIVTLTGTVDSAAEKAHAIELARRTKGVKNVVNRLTIEKKGTDKTHTRRLVAQISGVTSFGESRDLGSGIWDREFGI
jgi:hyperosmotically inducible protein